MKKLNPIYALFALTLLLINGCDTREDIADPVACFNYIPTSDIMVGDEVTFTNCSTDAISYEWNFGDGETSIAESPKHSFTEAKTYNITLIVKNKSKVNQVTKDVKVEINEPDIAACFSMSPNPAQLEENVTFTNCSTGADRYEWDFNSNGTVDSELENPVFYFTATGTFNVKLTAWSGEFSDEVTHQLVIEDGGSGVEACFTISPNPAQLEENVTFTNCSTGADRYEWDIDGNGTIDTDAENPVFIFHVADTYNVTLTAWSGESYDEVTHQLVIEDGGSEVDPTEYGSLDWVTPALYLNDFSESGDWYEGTGEDYELFIADGYYTMIDNNSSTDHGGYFITNEVLAIPSSGNWDLEVIIRNTVDNDQLGSGLIFGRESGENNYNFYKFKYGYYRLGDTDGWWNSWTYTTDGNVEDWNFLTIRKYNDMFYFFINAVYLYSYDYNVYGDLCGFSFDRNTTVDIDAVGMAETEPSTKKFSAAKQNLNKTNYTSFKRKTSSVSTLSKSTIIK